MRKRSAPLVIGTLLFMLAAACAKERAPNPAPPATTTRSALTAQGAPQAAPARAPVFMLDQTHTRAPADDERLSAQRIVSLAPAVTETLFALGLGERVVGVTRYCDRPNAAKKLPKVGGYVDVQIERVLQLKPDLVVAMPSLGQRDTLVPLLDAHIPVLVGFGDTLDEMAAFAMSLGRQLDRPVEAAAIATELTRGLTPCAAPKGTRILALVGTRPMVAAGPRTFIGEMLTQLHLVNASSSDGPDWPRVSLESLTALSPSHIVLAGNHGGGAPPDTLNGTRTLTFDPPIFVRPGPHVTADARRLCRRLSAAPDGTAP